MTFHADSFAKQQQQQQPDSASFTLSQVWQRAMLLAGLVSPGIRRRARALRPWLAHRSACTRATPHAAKRAQPASARQHRAAAAAASAHDGCCMLRCQAPC
jgi:hypothetical protein